MARNNQNGTLNVNAASLVTTPQPPAVVSTIVLGPFGSGCVANVAAP
mgnify:CR=1 FL=1